MLADGNTHVVGQGHILFEWICRKSTQAESMFNPDDQTPTISVIQKYFFREMRANTSQLISRLALKKLDPEKAPNARDPSVKQKVEVRLHEFRE